MIHRELHGISVRQSERRIKWRVGLAYARARGPVQTPEPSTLWLGLAGLLAARELRRRRIR